MNNFKRIRGSYGAAQEQIVSAIDADRVTVANWESGSSSVSNSD